MVDQVEERPVIKRVEGLPFPKKVEALHENKEKPAADKVRTEILAPTTISQEVSDTYILMAGI